MNKVRRNYNMKINKKAISSIIIFTLLMNALLCISGAFLFDKVIKKLYNERGYVVANIILDQIDHDKIAEYSKSWKTDDYYEKMEIYLKSIQEKSNAAYIYIGVPSENKNIKYIYDSGSEMGFVDPISAPFDEIWTAYTKGIVPTGYLERRSKYGFLTSSCLPIIDSTGKVAALLFVDTNMEVILSTLNNYVLRMVIISVILLAIFCYLNWHFLNKNLINPIMIIRKNVRHFAENNAQNDHSLAIIKTNDEIEELAVSVNSMENSIIDYIDNIRIIMAEKERIGAELNIATQIQADMLPRIFPPFPDRKEFDIYATMRPAKEVGGDFYDFFLIDDDHIAMVMADVSGKGVPAALFMVISKTLIKNRTLMDKKLSPSEILTDVNNQLCEGNEAEFFVTVWLGILQISTGMGIAANAGHENPAIKRKNGRFELIKYKHSPALATMKGIKIKEHEFYLKTGDSFFVYTDGVTEATNKDVQLFGTDRMLDALNNSANADAKTLLENVRNEIDNFVGDAPQFDDITMLGFKYFG